MIRTMPRAFRGTILTFLSAMGTVGCRVSGTWTMDAVDPPGASFPLHQLVLDPNQGYSALWTENGKQKGSSGQYRWNGYQLKVAQAGRDPRTYGARLGLDGKLRMTYRENDQSVTATLIRQSAAVSPTNALSPAPTNTETSRSKPNDLSPAPPSNAARRTSQPR